MICREYRNGLMEWARGAVPPASVSAHVLGCAACAQFLEEQQALTEALEAAACVEIPPAALFAGPVMAELDRAARSSKVRVLRWVATAVLAAAACLTVFVSPAARPAKKAPAPIADEGQFVPMPYTVPLSPEESTTVVRMDIPASALIAAGFQMPATDPGVTVRVDVLVSEDGRARAIRPISISNTN